MTLEVRLEDMLNNPLVRCQINGPGVLEEVLCTNNVRGGKVDSE